MQEIVTYLFISIGIGMFGDAFSDYMRPGMILHKYSEWLDRLGWWGKPLGSCYLCFNFWLVLVAVICINNDLHVIPYTLSAIGISNFIIKKIWS